VASSVQRASGPAGGGEGEGGGKGMGGGGEGVGEGEGEGGNGGEGGEGTQFGWPLRHAAGHMMTVSAESR
jgi:hypothetical protein